MTRLFTDAEILRQFDKPQLSVHQSVKVDVDDAVIVCAGFEERAVEIAAHRVDGLCGHALVVEYLPETMGNRLAELTAILRSRSRRLSTVVYDRREPSGAGEAIISEINDSAGRIYLDISGMSRLLIVQILAAIARHPATLARLVILYAEAEHYPPDQATVAEQIRRINTSGSRFDHPVLLSSGVFDVIAVPELSSVSLAGQPIRLIAFPSFNSDQFFALTADIQAARVTVIHGVPPREHYRWRTNAIRTLNDIDATQPRDEFSCDTLDYADTLNLLLDLYSLHGTWQRFVIAPTGSKMQAVAIGLLRGAIDDIQVVYPTPKTFAAPEDYTTGVRQLHALDMASWPLWAGWLDSERLRAAAESLA
jgi:hypothetical protein